MYETISEFEYNGNTFAVINHHGQQKVLSYASGKMVILLGCHGRQWLSHFEEKVDIIKAMHAPKIIQTVLENEVNGLYTKVVSPEWVHEHTGIPIDCLRQFDPYVPVSFKVELVEPGEVFYIVNEGGDEEIRMLEEVMTFRT